MTGSLTTIIIKLSFLSLLIFLTACQTSPAYWPNKSTPSLTDEFEPYYNPIKIKTADKLELTHWYARKKLPVILVFHSNAGNLQQRWSFNFNKRPRIFKYNFLLQAGYSVLIASYRGYGNNPGSPTEQHLIKDAEIILQWLMKNENISSKDIILFGESLGSAVSIALAEKYQVKGLILEGAPSSFVDVGKNLFPFVSKTRIKKILKENTWNSKERIQKVYSPILFLHRTKDYMVSLKLGKKLFESANDPKKLFILKGKGHINTLKHIHAQEAVLKFISQPHCILNKK